MFRIEPGTDSQRRQCNSGRGTRRPERYYISEGVPAPILILTSDWITNDWICVLDLKRRGTSYGSGTLQQSNKFKMPVSPCCQATASLLLTASRRLSERWQMELGNRILKRHHLQRRDDPLLISLFASTPRDSSSKKSERFADSTILQTYRSPQPVPTRMLMPGAALLDGVAALLARTTAPRWKTPTRVSSPSTSVAEQAGYAFTSPHNGIAPASGHSCFIQCVECLLTCVYEHPPIIARGTCIRAEETPIPATHMILTLMSRGRAISNPGNWSDVNRHRVKIHECVNRLELTGSTDSHHNVHPVGQNHVAGRHPILMSSHATIIYSNHLIISPTNCRVVMIAVQTPNRMSHNMPSEVMVTSDLNRHIQKLTKCGVVVTIYRISISPSGHL